MENRYILVLSTAPDAESAAIIGKAVVEEGLAACCNIIPGLRSIYRWKGNLCDEREVLCLFKTRATLFDGLRERIRSLHPYEVPEIISMNIGSGLDAYLEWIGESTKG